jgi:hypothetical protein
MDRAEQYADWIVRNADKRGTPEFDTVAKAYQAARQGTMQSKPETMSWGQAAGQAVGNIPSSAMNLVKGVVQSVTSPIETGRNLLDVAAGGLQNILPERLVQAVGEEPVSRQKAGAVWQFYKERYGSEEGLKQAIANDPVGVASDAAAVLGLGGAALSKVPKLGGVGQAISKAGAAIDPFSQALKGAGKATGFLASEITGLQTGAGGQAVREAYKAGAAGGKPAQAFKKSMRGGSDMMDVLDQAKQSVSEMGAERSTAYRSGMAAVSGDKSVLSFQNIDKSLGDAIKSVSYKGQIKAPTAAEALGKIRTEVVKWKQLDPAQFHTPEGLDALKQRIGDIRESIPLNESNARRVAGQVYNSIKKEIASQAPVYAKTMEDYSKATESIKEIERTLSLGEKAAPDTTLRKLQSVLRNNVNTNYGRRAELAKQIDTRGTLIPSIAGQSLSEFTPRGIQRMAAAPTAVMAGMTPGGIPAAIAAGIASSPRLVGEMSYGAGSLERMIRGLVSPGTNSLESMNIPPELLGNLLYQAQQPKEAR